MTPTTFTNKTRALGLHRKYIGPDAVAELAQVVQCPAPCVEKAGWVDRSKAPSALRSMGKLIAAGLARLNPDAKQYEATDDGRQWLAKLAKHNLLPAESKPCLIKKCRVEPANMKTPTSHRPAFDCALVASLRFPEFRPVTSGAALFL